MLLYIIGEFSCCLMERGRSCQVVLYRPCPVYLGIYFCGADRVADCLLLLDFTADAASQIRKTIDWWIGTLVSHTVQTLGR